jgi:hypothetical protein
VLRSILSGLLASAIAILIALVGLEFAVRALGMGNDATAQPHPWTGWVLIPNARVEFVFGCAPGWSHQACSQHRR